MPPKDLNHMLLYCGDIDKYKKYLLKNVSYVLKTEISFRFIKKKLKK